MTQGEEPHNNHPSGTAEDGGLGSILEEEASKKPYSGATRHLDLDDFANSPAADADDAADDDSGEDIEMRVTLA